MFLQPVKYCCGLGELSTPDCSRVVDTEAINPNTTFFHPVVDVVGSAAA
jgi:hypothetical protein